MGHAHKTTKLSAVTFADLDMIAFRTTCDHIITNNVQ